MSGDSSTVFGLRTPLRLAAWYVPALALWAAAIAGAWFDSGELGLAWLVIAAGPRLGVVIFALTLAPALLLPFAISRSLGERA